ncbi:MAG: hypothetical protein EPN37_18420 [Chitinophagaceae bacterium]|nr:MAG: hypothetical protein EPN37_18420 [Chitinophagaceae bacterium]
MKSSLKYSLWIAGLLSVLAVAFLPGPTLKEKIETALQHYLDHYPQEKIYLQTDKDYYAAGGTVWFKAYITSDYLPTPISTILYAELLNTKGKVLQRLELPIKDGGAWGDFDLSPDMHPGDYRIRAYTMWMLNFDPAFLYKKDIHIFEPGTPPPASNGENIPSDFAVQFFPEGGDLVDSLQSLVAFKGIDQDGFPEDVKGKITDGQGRFIDSIYAVHDGMGSFHLTPLPGQTYQALMTNSSGKTKTFELQAAKSSGVVMHIIPDRNNRLFFQVKRSSNIGTEFNNLYLAAQIGGHLVYYAPIDFSQGYSGGMIPVDKDPAGIMQITLFTPEGIPLAERLAFVKNKDALLPLTLQKDSVSLQPRGKNVFTLDIPDTLTGNFSVAVTDAGQVQQTPERDNIISHLLLTSDIKGYVYDPAWYFRNNNEATNHGLDLVMLTNGWRRFVWQKILNDQFPEVKLPPEMQGIQVSGQAFDRKGPLKNGKITMMLRAPADTLTYFISGATQPNGYFEIGNLDFHDSATLYYQSQDTLHKGRSVTVRFLSSPASQNYELLHTPVHPWQPVRDATLNNYLTQAVERNNIQKYINSRSVLLKEVNVTARRIPETKKLEDRYTTGMFKSDDGYTFDLTRQNLPYISIFQYLQGRVAGLMISGGPMSPSVRWRGGTPGFFLDEVPVSAEDIANVPVNDIALVKVYRPPFYGGFGGGSGAIAIYTKKGGDEDYSPGKGFDKIRIPGYSIVRQFYSPDYAVNKKVNELPDKRATLYWNPDLKIDSTSHQVTFSFYNTDITKRMRIIIEGISNNGKIGRIEEVAGEQTVGRSDQKDLGAVSGK